MKPRFHLLCWGPVREILPGSTDFAEFVHQFPAMKDVRRVAAAKATVGMVEYDTPQGSRFMMLDTGMATQWPEISTNMGKAGCDDLTKVTHILQTHWDEDHFENITRFSPHKPVCVWGGSGPLYAPQNGRILILGTPFYVETEHVYGQGYVEDPNIRFHYVFRAHSRDEMYFIIDSENEGKIGFLGDLIHSPVAEQPIQFIVGRDRLYTLDVFRKYEVLREIYEKHADVDKFYVGHAARTLTRTELADNLCALEGEGYRPLLEEFIAAGRETLRRYESLLDAMKERERAAVAGRTRG